MKQLKRLKVYSWKTLLITLVLGGGAIIYYIKKLMAGDGWAILYIIFLTYLFLRGMWASLTEDGFEDDNVNKNISETVYKRLFGKWWLIAPWGGLILISLALLSLVLFPSQIWISIILFIIGAIYHVAGAIIVSKHVKRERRNRFL